MPVFPILPPVIINPPEVTIRRMSLTVNGRLRTPGFGFSGNSESKLPISLHYLLPTPNTTMKRKFSIALFGLLAAGVASGQGLFFVGSEAQESLLSSGWSAQRDL
jgi:hypothetical protein